MIEHCPRKFDVSRIVEKDLSDIWELIRRLGFDEQIEVTDDEGMVRMSREKFEEKYGDNHIQR